MKKVNVYMLTIALAATLGIVACAGQTANDPTEPAETGSTEIAPGFMGIANPWSDLATLEEAEEVAGFEMTVPDTVDGYKLAIYRAMDNDMLEVRYTAGDEEVNIRKSIDAYDGDNSGVYGDYKKTTAEVGGNTVTVSSEGDLAYIATWTVDGYSYSVYASAGMKQADLLNIVADVA